MHSEIWEAQALFIPGFAEQSFLCCACSSTQVPEVQVHEPYLATSHAEALQLECSHAFQELAAEGVPLNLVVAYDDVGEWGRQEQHT